MRKDLLTSNIIQKVNLFFRIRKYFHRGYKVSIFSENLFSFQTAVSVININDILNKHDGGILSSMSVKISYVLGLYNLFLLSKIIVSLRKLFENNNVQEMCGNKFAFCTTEILVSLTVIQSLT